MVERTQNNSFWARQFGTADGYSCTFYQAGQSCVAVQRVIVHKRVAAEFTDLLVRRVRALATGDPGDDATQVGPLVDVEAALRIERWVAEAVTAGARLLCGGARDGASYAPTVLVDVPPEAKVWSEEVFGPGLALTVVGSDDEAFAVANASSYGLQAGAQPRVGRDRHRPRFAARSWARPRYRRCPFRCCRSGFRPAVPFLDRPG
ncbi:aldehyde dehydrogenase family protein [Dactylosporangium sp. NPDC000521]|uniref:aldehyde dehydrogenase family protein n=1 Tax=Dactylosporangium sp. NPDC000521 TaxID=3363975 RepID=UPI0036C438A5